MDWLDYREKLGIGFNDTDKTNYFFVKIFNILDGVCCEMNLQINEDEYYSFCNMTGTPMKHGELYGQGYKYIIDVLYNHRQKFTDFISYYIAFINCQTDNKNKRWTKENFINVICNIMDESHIPFELIKDDNNYFLFPKGAKELDDALVSKPLNWLENYPKAHKAFVDALKDYSSVTPDNASKVADEFRKALETFFQEFFNSTKTLEHLKSEYGTYMKSKGVPPEISNNLETLQLAYTNYMNNYAKHHDKTSINVLEYIMYQTGNIIRLLITLSKEDK